MLLTLTHVFQPRNRPALFSPFTQAAEAAASSGRLPLLPNGRVDYSKDFFGEPSFLTVSGQLNGEMYACAMGDIYTFGPTFRAENSNTARHLAEFWMIEPEMVRIGAARDGRRGWRAKSGLLRTIDF